MKGEKFLKVTSILMIIGGIVAIIFSVIALIAAVTLIALLGGKGVVVVLGCIIALAGGIVELIAGFKGNGACKVPENAAGCVSWGIVVVVMSVVSLILSIAGGGDFKISNLIANLVIPVLYIVGAIQMKNEIAAGASNNGPDL